MSLWIKWSAGAHRDAVIASLTDTQFRAFIVVLEVAKEMRKGGEFRDRQHLAAVVGTSAQRQQRARAQKEPLSRFGHAIEQRESRAEREKRETLTNGVMSVGEIILRGGKA